MLIVLIFKRGKELLLFKKINTLLAIATKLPQNFATKLKKQQGPLC